MGPSRTHRITHHTATTAIAAFTLIEVMVALGIVSVIMAITLTGNASFNETVLLRQAGYDFATSLREAQSFGIASRNANAGYGIYVPSTEGGGASSYMTFLDSYPSPWDASELCHPLDNPNLPNARWGNCTYDSSDDELVRGHTFTRNFHISAYCGEMTDGTFVCTQITSSEQTCAPSSEGGLQGLSVVFVRPNTDAIIKGVYGNGYTEDFVSVTFAVQGEGDAVQYVTVRDTGQIRVHAACS